MKLCKSEHLVCFNMTISSLNVLIHLNWPHFTVHTIFKEIAALQSIKNGEINTLPYFNMF